MIMKLRCSLAIVTLTAVSFASILNQCSGEITQCVNGGFRCDNGQCTAQIGDRCDGIKHCSDGSDENVKSCSPPFHMKLRQLRQAMIDTTQPDESNTPSTQNVPSTDPPFEVFTEISTSHTLGSSTSSAAALLLGIIVGVIVVVVIVILIIIVAVVVITVLCVTCGIAASQKSSRRHIQTGGNVVTVVPVVQTVPASAGQPGAYPMQPTETAIPMDCVPAKGHPSGQADQLHEEVDSQATNPQDPKLTQGPPPAYPGTEVTSQQQHSEEPSKADVA